MNTMKISDNTKFIYILTSKDPLEARFALDIARCVIILSGCKGVKLANQTIVSDTSKGDLAKIQSYLGMVDVIDSSLIYDCIRSVDCDNLFIISSCHGTLYGIDSKNIIRPHDFINAIKENSHVKNCVAILGQCYAGFFNYLDLSCEGKNIVFIGAAEMREGLSTVMSWTVNGNKWDWCANIFIYHFVSWIHKYVDVDNDGIYSIVDLYKFISFWTNQRTQVIEKDEVKKYWDEKIKNEIGKVNTTDSDSTEIDKLDEEASKDLDDDYIIPHQDCWILNAEAAININIED